MSNQIKVDRLLQALGISGGATVEDIVGLVSDLTNLTIEIDPVGDRDWETVTGLVLVNEGYARIIVRKSDPRWYQLHVVLHELAHLLYGHAGCATLPTAFDDLRKRNGTTVLARGAVQVGATGPEAIMEREAEALSHRLSEFVLAPRFAADEAIFG